MKYLAECAESAQFVVTRSILMDVQKYEKLAGENIILLGLHGV